MAPLGCRSFIYPSPSPSPSQRSRNKIIKKHMLEGNPERALRMYIDMQEIGFHADNFTFPILLKAVGSLSLCRRVGYGLHGQTIKAGFCAHVFVQTALLNMYSSLHCIDDACKVFEKMSVKDVVAWNSMFDAYASCGQMDNAMGVFDTMPSKDILSYNIMIAGYANIGRVASARSIFDEVPVRDIVSWNSMILACTNAGDMEQACKLFKEMPKKNVISWNTMITGCLHSRLYTDAVDLFDEMKAGNFEPDHLTLTGVLSACAHLGSLETGREIHIYAQMHGLSPSRHVTTSLIDMYAKCGSIQSSLEVFFKCPVKDIYCWNAMISGLALHGYGSAVFKLFNDMRGSHVRLDDITFIGLLSACSHAGLVQEGCQLFDCMENNYGILPKLEHYGCMVDLLGRAGFLDRAFQLIEAMPFEPGETILGALLSACVINRDLETGEKVVKLISARARHLSDGEFMMLANLYASCGQWEEANRWRYMMNSAGIVKTAGYSVIQVNGRFYKFLAGEIGLD